MNFNYLNYFRNVNHWWMSHHPMVWITNPNSPIYTHTCMIKFLKVESNEIIMSCQHQHIWSEWVFSHFNNLLCAKFPIAPTLMYPSAYITQIASSNQFIIMCSTIIYNYWLRCTSLSKQNTIKPFHKSMSLVIIVITPCTKWGCNKPVMCLYWLLCVFLYITKYVMRSSKISWNSQILFLRYSQTKLIVSFVSYCLFNPSTVCIFGTNNSIPVGFQ